MILVDFSQIAMSCLMQEMKIGQGEEFDKNLYQHMLLNAIRSVNVKFRREYGHMTLCCDGGRTWRKQEYKYYKAKRKKAEAKADGTPIVWDDIFGAINEIIYGINDHFPLTVVGVEEAEGDDVIAIMAQEMRSTTGGFFDEHEPCLIVSGDEDFVQLQTLPGVRQFSPTRKEFVIKKEGAATYRKMCWLTGDSGDGVPNALSPDDVFVNPDIKQDSATAKIKEIWLECDADPARAYDEMVKRKVPVTQRVSREDFLKRAERTRQMVDLWEQPIWLRTRVREVIRQQMDAPRPSSSSVRMWLAAKRMKSLIELTNDFASG